MECTVDGVEVVLAAVETGAGGIGRARIGGAAGEKRVEEAPTWKTGDKLPWHGEGELRVGAKKGIVQRDNAYFKIDVEELAI